jgi:hypothetical protein
MKKIRYAVVATGALLMLLAFIHPATAFHEGGVAHCDGCHTMHNSVDGDTVTANPGSSLLRGSDASSVCLSCHEGSGSFRVLSDDGSNQTPGGDFFWQKVTISWQEQFVGTVVRQGYQNGHSIVAADFPELQPEQDLTTSPGGNFPSSILGCQSCHDPHGVKVNKTGPITGSGSFGGTAPPGQELGNYRILGDVGYSPTNSSVTFTRAPMIAVAPPYSNPNETDTNHTDYGSGSSEWCANCHAGLQVAGTGVNKHPNGNTVKLGEYVGNYNNYRATGEFGPGSGISFTNAYFALVPIERGTSNTQNLDRTSTQGAVDGQSNVSCLSCHRAHNSAFKYAGRWDFTQELLVNSHPQAGDTITGGTITGDPQTVAYYGRTITTAFNEFQRSLCNKCHHKD